MNTLDELGYDVADAEATGKDDPKIVDGKHFLPQHRERIVLVGFRRDLQLKQDFTLRNIDRYYPRSRPTFGELLELSMRSMCCRPNCGITFSITRKTRGERQRFWIWTG
jgi:site-specific DNA-cytosine methylase